MEIVTSNASFIKEAAQKVGVRAEAYPFGMPRDGRSRMKVLLYPEGEKFRKLSFSGRRIRRVNAVCFHGHKAFIDALFKLDPQAKLHSVMTERAGARWMTSGNFFDMAETISSFNVGSQIGPMQYEEGCSCNYV